MATTYPTPELVAESSSSELAALSPAWVNLKAAFETLRPLQAKDGSLSEAAHRPAAEAAVHQAREAIAELVAYFPHDSNYLETVRTDLARWVAGGFGVPDFLDSLRALIDIRRREDGLEHLVVFPMYTQNGNPSRNFEAVILTVVWPAWIAAIEATQFENPMFVPVAFTDFTAGYDTNSAVLFPETVAVREAEKPTWGAIFCDRESARFRSVIGAAVESLNISLPADAQHLLADPATAQETFVLWDLIHDRAHMRGDLPFDPFLVKQRLPYWLYSLEELRCDLSAIRGAVQLREQGEDRAGLVVYAAVLDRMLRFPITGERHRNYDSLGGQLLFAALRRAEALTWFNNTLTIDWDKTVVACEALLSRIEELYFTSIDRNRLSHWQVTYALVREFVEPHPASVWADGIKAMPKDFTTKDYLDAILPDEFPLSMFFDILQRRLRDVVASTKGIRA